MKKPMKKHMIYGLTAAAALTVTVAQPMTAMAASWAYTNAGNMQYKIVTGGKQGVNIKELLGNLNVNCDIPGINIPDISFPIVPDQPVKPDQPIVPDQPDQPIVPDQPDDGGSQDAWTRQVVELVNAERAKAGVGALTISSGASMAAQVRAMEITKSFSHTRPDGRTFSTALTEAGVSYTGSGENIAYGQRSPQAVMEQWMNSAGHRANILNPDFTAIGVGHYEGNNGTDYWTQLFIR